MNLFDFPQVHIDKPIRLITLFSGIGAQEMALRDIGADFEIWRAVEFDKAAIKSYNAIHGTDFQPLDIRNVHACDLDITDKDKYAYFMFYSWPCQDLSLAGRQRGMQEGSGTRSSLLWEVKRFIEEMGEAKPDILISENVPQCHSEQNKPEFDRWCEFLRKKGYVNHWKDLNARDYGIPQNRERCFIVSILSNQFVEYEWPNPIPLEKKMRDYLEENVDEKYYINSPKAQELIDRLVKEGKLGGGSTPVNTETDGTAMTIKANYGKMSAANFDRGNTFGATGVAVVG